jgi:hypothetical protein
MAYASSTVAPRGLDIPEKAPRAKRSPLRRLLDSIEQANMRQAEREIARYLSRRGGKFTDEAEREIERRFLSNQ